MTAYLAMTVGTGRERTDIAGALHYSIVKHQPNTVVFFCSRKTEQETLPEILRLLDWPPQRYRVHVFEDVDNVEQLYQQYLTILRTLDDVVVDFTSGTKAMSSALFAAAIAVEASKVSYVIGNRDDGGRVNSGTENLLAFSPALVLADRQLERARNLFNHLDFHAAFQLADGYRRSLPEGSALQKLAKTLYLLGKGYDLWDHFKWKEAAHDVQKAANPRENLLENVDTAQLEKSAAYLKIAGKDGYSAERLIDLGENARRRLWQVRYDDALARMYRAYEYLIQYRFMNEYGIDTGRVKLTQLSGFQFCEKTEGMLQRNANRHNGSAKLGLRQGLELLAEMKDGLGKALIKLYWKPGSWTPQKEPAPIDAGDLQVWLTQRNESLMAHGTRPAKKETVQFMLDTYDKLLEHFVPDLDKLKQNATMLTL